MGCKGVGYSQFEGLLELWFLGWVMDSEFGVLGDLQTA